MLKKSKYFELIFQYNSYQQIIIISIPISVDSKAWYDEKIAQVKLLGPAGKRWIQIF